MKITVIGHLCLDFPADQSSVSAEQSAFEYGGIYYAVATLANLASADDEVVPVFGVGESDYDDLMERLKKYSNVDRSGIFRMTGPTNRVRVLSANGSSSRIECSTHIAPAIPFSRIEPYLNTDGVIVNMISGFDITIETLDHIRMYVRDRGTPVHLDIHSLTLGIEEHSKRFRRPLTDWRRWCFMLSCIQLNQEEAAGLTAERYDETTLINHLMPLMVNTVVITRGKEGATVITQDRKRLSRHEIAPVQTDSSYDPPGCGDVFGAAYFYNLLKSNDPVSAAEIANRIAAWKSTFTGSHRLDSLQQQFKGTAAF